jgi:hypothetical protein
MQATNSLDHQLSILDPQNTNNSSTLYVHWPYHPHGIQRHTIRRLYNDILQPLIPFDKMQVAISRPKNLRDILTRASLELPDNLSVHALTAQQTNTVCQ